MSNSVAVTSARTEVFSRFLTRVAVVSSFALVISSFYFLRAADPDLWWHIKAGEIVASTYDVPRQDTYSFTAQGAKWTDHEWATNLIFYYVYTIFGDSGLTVFKTLLGLGIAIILFKMAQAPDRGTQLLVLILASEMVACFALYRPQLVTYLFLAVLLWLMIRKEEIAVRGMVFILFLFVLWANLHGGFLAGLALLAGHAFVSGLRGFLNPQLRAVQWTTAGRLAFLVVASSLATLINPYGYGLWQSLADEMTVNPLNHRYINEWASFYTARSAFGLDGQLTLFMAFLCVVGFILRRREWSLEDIGLAVGTFALALYSVRNIPFFALAAAAPLAKSLGAFMSEYQGKALARRLFLLFLGITLMPLFLMTYLVFKDPGPEIRVRPDNMGGDPARAVAFIVANQITGNLYNPLAWGGYLIWHLPPQTKVSVDGRSSTVYSREILLDTFRFYANEASPDLPLARGADFVLLDAKSPVVQAMRSDRKWTAVYQDKEAVLFAGPSTAGKRLIRLLENGLLTMPEILVAQRFP
jgi:hypothetical protein